LKNIAKATSIYVVVVVLVMDRRFIQMRSLLQEVVQLGLELSSLID